MSLDGHIDAEDARFYTIHDHFAISGAFIVVRIHWDYISG